MSKYYKTKENVVFDTIVNLVMIFTPVSYTHLTLPTTSRV